MNKLRVGVVGYCPPTKFDEVEARRMVVDAFDHIAAEHADYEIEVVSGLTNVGVLGIAYEEAVKRGWKTVGIACKKALEHPLFPVDEMIMEGENWGDESPRFLSSIDMMVRIGGGKQSARETEEVKSSGRQALEYDLPPLP